ncbi:MAG: extracellular solute-binding protein [Candidatus Moraniibacteriota bacterium]
MRKKNILKLTILTALFSCSLLFSGCSILKERKENYKINLEVWGVFDDSDFLYDLNKQFKKINPNVDSVKYKKIANNLVDYEEELTDAIAAGNGPDVFFFNNNWLSEHQNKISPLPNSSQEMSTFKSNFVDVAHEDFVKDGNIYAMPLYCDTLALFYNKDIFNQEGITQPPRTWGDVIEYTKKLTEFDSSGDIEQSAIAMGRSKKPGGVNRSSDILTLLLMQSGVDIYNKDRERTSFANQEASENVLNFYTQFSMADSKAYTWNSEMDYSIDSFRYGKTAMMINYSYWKKDLQKKEPKLNFATSPVPQHDLDNKVNFPNYWGLAVVKNKVLQPSSRNEEVNYTNQDRINLAWEYIKYATQNPTGKEYASSLEFDPNKKYLETSQKPAARKDLIEEQKNDTFIGDFAVQALTAKSWNQPKNLAVEEILVNMIDEVVSGKKTSQEALRSAQSRINALEKN